MKKFLIIGNMNAITYKEIFPYIKNNKMWMGVSFNKSKWFKVPDDYKKMDNATGYKEENGEKYILVKSIAWFTNMEHNKINEPLILTKKYDPALYPKYDNYDAINVDKVSEIPMDYDGVMGVPITFLGKYYPEQFEIVGCPDADVLPEGWNGASKEFVNLYYAQGNTGQYQEGNRLAHYISKDGKAKIPYSRILIKRKI